LPLSLIQGGLLKVMSALAPGVAIQNHLSTNHLSHDPTMALAYNNDPRVHHKISVRLLTSMLKTGEFSLTVRHSLTVSTLLLVADGTYLVYLGLKILFEKQALSTEKCGALDLRPHKTIFLQALITNVMHPKVILSFLSFFRNS